MVELVLPKHRAGVRFSHSAHLFLIFMQSLLNKLIRSFVQKNRRGVVRIVRRRRVVRVSHLRGRKSEHLAHKDAAREIVHQKLLHFNQHYQYTYHRVTIRNQKSRWASCSKKGNLNFHYKLALMPEPLVDYIIVHELCHLKAFNHSPSFWSLVAETIPDHKTRRRELRSIARGGQ